MLHYLGLLWTEELIAAQLSETTRTVRGHVSNILSKLRLSSRTEAAKVARSLSLTGC